LRILENEQLVERYPHRGTFVTGMTMRDAEEIYSLRGALESLAIDFAIKNATDEQFGELEAVIEDMNQRRSEAYTPDEATEVDLVFHEAVCRISGHQRVLSAWLALRSQVNLLILTHRILQPADFREKGVEWHRELLDSLRKRDAAVAHEVLRRHLAASYDTVVTALGKGEADAEISREPAIA
jgi:DNA-binding GntR family transcriptional regulator